MLKLLSRLSIGTLVLIYFAGAIFTNAYMQKYRYNHWQSLHSETRTNAPAGIKLGVGSIFWPVYLTFIGSDVALDWIENGEISLDSILNSDIPEDSTDTETTSCDGQSGRCFLPSQQMTPTQQLIIPETPKYYEVPRTFSNQRN